MSAAYEINKVCHRAEHDPAFREALRTAPRAALATFRLPSDAVEALLAGDVAQLYRMGAHAYLLGHLRRHELFGLDRARYEERIRDAGAP